MGNASLPVSIYIYNNILHDSMQKKVPDTVIHSLPILGKVSVFK